MSRKDSFKSDLELKFLASADLESLTGLNPAEQSAVHARNALRLLMMGWSPDWHTLINWSTFKAVMLRRNPDLLRHFRFAFQQGFLHLYQQLQDQQFNTEQREQIEIYLSNCLGLLPYSDITPYESIQIPQSINGQWTLVEYNIVPIELTPQTGFKKLILKDSDRVFAYGLEPFLNDNATAHLIFMGTTYPAGQGFLPQINTDLKGFETVGESLYRTGRARIHEWLVKQQNRVHVCGVSLGGSLSLLLAIDQGDKLSRVDAMNPAGLHDSRLKNRYDKWDELQNKPKVVIQKQDRDPVSSLGVWKNDWELLKIIPPKDKQGPNAYCDHVLNYAGFAGTEFNYLAVDEVNAKRKARNFWLYGLGRSVIYYLMVLPYRYLVRPVLHVLWDKKNYVLTALFVGLCVMGLTVSGIVASSVAFTALVVTALSVGALFMVFMIKSRSLVEDPVTTPPKLHAPNLPRIQDMDIYNAQNNIAVTFTYGQLQTYYKMMRCLLKGKELLPQEEKGDGHNKRAILIAAQDPKNLELPVQINTTKAKARHITTTLKLLETFADHSELKEVLSEHHRQYRLGKFTL